MRIYQRCMAWGYALFRRGSQRGDSDKRSEAMLHNHDFERGSSTYLSDLQACGNQDIDPARAPRGMFIGIGIALGLWGSAVLAVLALR